MVSEFETKCLVSGLLPKGRLRTVNENPAVQPFHRNGSVPAFLTSGKSVVFHFGLGCCAVSVMFELLIAGYAACTGFVAAGLIGSFYQLMTSEPPRFGLKLDTWIRSFSSAFFCIFAGPFIIMRNAIRGQRIEHRPIGWLAGSCVVALMWSTCSGIIVLQMALIAVS